MHSPPVPGRVVLMPLEDPEDSVVVPRLRSAGVDMANVVILGDVVEPGADGDAEAQLQLPRDLDLLAAECAETRPELLVIDPFFAVLGLDEIKQKLTGKLRRRIEHRGRRRAGLCRGSGQRQRAAEFRAVARRARLVKE